MCTMTLVALPDAPAARLRIAFNRDESRQRPAARPPQIRTFGKQRAILPIDPPSDGTWIAVNDAGLAAGLLNVYGPSGAANRAVRPGARSRGTIIPSLMDCAALDAAFERISGCATAAGEFSPFDLVLTDGRSWAKLRFANGSIQESPPQLISAPLLFTSSGLGDDLVQPPRRRLFEEMFSTGSPAAQQDAFHRHRWPDHPELSVCMSRREARTVNFTIVEIGQEAARLTWWPAPPNEPADSATLSIPLTAQ